MKKWNIYKVLSIILAVVLLVLAAVFVKQKLDQRAEEKALQEMADGTISYGDDSAYGDGSADSAGSSGSSGDADEDAKSHKLDVDIPEKDIDWKELQKENADIYAWIYIPGTQVDYPVLQHPKDDTYYLNHCVDGKEGYPGCIYTESINKKDFSDRNTVLYGHNMKSGSMFGSLRSYRDSTFFDENKYCFVYLPNGKVLAYQLFGAYEWENTHIIDQYRFQTDAQLQEYLDEVFALRDMNAHFAENVEVTGKDHILTLSTCVTGTSKRYIVQFVLLNDWNL